MMDFLFDIRQHRGRIRDGLRASGHYLDADYLYLALADARPSLVSTSDGREAVIYTAQGYAVVVTDMTGCQIPLKDDWLIGVYMGDLTSQPEEVLVLDCGH